MFTFQKANTSTKSELLHKALDGFIPSITALGCIRAWLSAQTGAYPPYETNIIVSTEIELLQHIAFIAFFLFFTVFKFGSYFSQHRRFFSLLFGSIGSVVFILGHYLVLETSWTNALFVIMLALLFVFMMRLWSEDNSEVDYRLIILRLALSFVVQYIVYTCVYVLPKELRPLCAIILPLIIGFLLMSPPSPSTTLEGKAKKTPVSAVPLTKVIPLAAMVGFFCAGHGILFLSSSEVTGTWTLGSLIIALIAIAFVFHLQNESLFKGIVCAVLFIQCLSALLILAFHTSIDLISLSKSLSYALSMLLALSVGCRIGASLQQSPGRVVSALMAVYFVAFYVAWHIGMFLMLDTFTTIFIVIVFLIFAASLMIINDWSIVFAKGTKENILSKMSDEKLNFFQERLTRVAGLTPRESDILYCLLIDLSTKEIASRSHISTNTVRTQVQAVYRKLDIHSRDDLKSLLT